jgi:hypothetical protein
VFDRPQSVWILKLQNYFGTDRRLALLSILKSMLVTYSSFLGALLAPPPPPSAASSGAPPEWHRQVEWITILAQNVMAAANDLRPVQVRRRFLCLTVVGLYVGELMF